MPSKSNQEMLDKVKADVEASAGVFVVDYKGLSVKETQSLRRALTANGARMKVYKNNIVKIALEEAGLPTLLLDGDSCDRAFGGEGQAATRMEAFLELLEARSPGKEAL